MADETLEFIPLSRTIKVGFVLFIVVLSVALSLAVSLVYNGYVRDRYQEQLSNIADYVTSHIDVDDMAACARDLEESDAYVDFQGFVDDFSGNYPYIHHLRLMQVTGPEDSRVYAICSANSAYVKEHEPNQQLLLGDVDEWHYDAGTTERLWRVQQGDEDVFFLNRSLGRADYTLARPLVDSEGDHFGLICADVDASELDQGIVRTILVVVAVIAVPGIIVTLIILFWLRRYVTDPLNELGTSVSAYAALSRGRRDPNEVVFYPPELHVRNEVRLLSDRICDLSQSMQDYVRRMLAAEDEAQEYETQAYTDALTGVGNKAAYERDCEELEAEISSGTARFALIMADINNLKRVNDTYGHENGDVYIKGTCDILCNEFGSSVVYRYGGDEFALILKGTLYDERDEHVARLKERYEETGNDESREPWERYSASVGMSCYEPGDDVDAVLKRADDEMYAEKQRMKVGRG